jgi:hypothetical protein
LYIFPLSPQVNQTVQVDQALTVWGSVELCYYCVFTSVVATIYAIIWLWFFLLLSNWKFNLDFEKLARKMLTPLNQQKYVIM